MKKDEQILTNCSFVKTFLMLLVVLCHACAFWTGNWFTEDPQIQSRTLGIISSWLGQFHIYAFALVSGYLFTYKVCKGEYTRYIPFLCNKAKRLLIPYLFAMLIWVAPISAYYLKLSLIDLVKKYILCINPSQLWFLWMLFGVFAFIWPLRKKMLESPILGWTVSLMFYAVGIVGNKFIPNVFCIWTSCQYVIFFYIGMRIRIKTENKEKKITESIHWMYWVIAELALFAVNALIERKNGITWGVISIGLNFVLHFVGAIMAWVFLQQLANKFEWKRNKLFKILSMYVMPIYLFHQQFIYFSVSALNGVVNPWINVGVNFIVAIAGAIIISEILMHWKLTRVLIGEKT